MTARRKVGAVEAVLSRLPYPPCAGLPWREVDTFAARWLLFAPFMVCIGRSGDGPRDGGLTCADHETWARIPLRALASVCEAKRVQLVRDDSGYRMNGRLYDSDYIDAIGNVYPSCEWRAALLFGDGNETADRVAYAFSGGHVVGVVAAMRSGL